MLAEELSVFLTANKKARIDRHIRQDMLEVLHTRQSFPFVPFSCSKHAESHSRNAFWKGCGASELRNIANAFQTHYHGEILSRVSLLGFVSFSFHSNLARSGEAWLLYLHQRRTDWSVPALRHAPVRRGRRRAAEREAGYWVLLAEGQGSPFSFPLGPQCFRRAPRPGEA